MKVKKNDGLSEGNFWKILKKIKNRGLKQEQRVQIAPEVMAS